MAAEFTFSVGSSIAVVISGNSTILSENRTFELGFFTADAGSNWYVGIWYSSIPIRTYIWVANRLNSVKNQKSATISLNEDGRMIITDSNQLIVWTTENAERAAEAKLLDTGNLVLLSQTGAIVWQSFDFPADTWLPGMNITRNNKIVCWRSVSDPSPGNYSLRLRSPGFGEFELVHDEETRYWSTGIWTGSSFSGIPEMSVRYLYTFRFSNPFNPSASFTYETLPEFSNTLTRFSVDSFGLLKQYTWSSQTENWNMFWSRPENVCRVYGLCGNLGFCTGGSLRPCECIAGYVPADEQAWRSGGFNGGCRRDDEKSICQGDGDGFEDVGVVNFDGSVDSVVFTGGRSLCEETCLKNCSCVAMKHNEESGMCNIIFGSILNIQNLTSDSTDEIPLYIRVGRDGFNEENKMNGGWRLKMVLIIIAGCVFMALCFVALALVILRMIRNKEKRKKFEEEMTFPVTNLKVFSHKELTAATSGFTEMLGHGGFGAVFRGTLSDASEVAVKRLEHPTVGRDKEFRAELCTIGNIQHVNLVRLRGFCLEDSHRLLVYDYMENGPLSGYLKRDGEVLSWDVRLRIAIGTARGIAYLHEECRDCIVHCDIKPENILLDNGFNPKVSDFGMAKLIGRDFSRVLTTMRGTWGYLAPEWISGVAITAKADVYSYGMTLLEILGGRRNVETPPSVFTSTRIEGASQEDHWFFPPWAARQIVDDKVSDVLDGRLQGAYNPVEARRLALVAVWCIQDNESCRPTMGMVVRMLEGTLEVTVPSPPQLLQALVSGDSFQGVRVVSGQESSLSSGTCSFESNKDTGVSPS
ncbi:hypothetical protein Scep_026279 [Stephania cephalantha]|uniref:Receptor-like serine/threonine-protein kinase n=1 Tax=Stephania cephalantha TaxID=152367 RepID=A0AAP0EJU4_9MAGN